MENIRLIRSTELDANELGCPAVEVIQRLYVVTNPAWNKRLKDKSSHVGFARHCETLVPGFVQGVKFSPRADAFIFEALDF